MRLQQGRPSRWRPADRGAHREGWAGPSLTKSARPTSNLSQYGHPDYVFGQTKIPFNVAELPDQPVRVRRAEMDVRRATRQPQSLIDRSDLPQRSSKNVRHPSVSEDYDSVDGAHKVSGARTKTPPGLRRVSISEAATSYRPRRLSSPNRSGSRPTSTTLVGEQATNRHRAPTFPSDAPYRPKIDSAHTQSGPQRWRRGRNGLFTNSTSPSDSDSTSSPNQPSSAAPQRERPRGNDDSVLRPASTGTYNPIASRHRRKSSEHGSRGRERPDPAKVRLRRRPRSAKRDRGDVETATAARSSSAVYPPASSRRTLRPRRSSRSSSRHE